MKNRNIHTENDDSDNPKKNTDNKKLGDKIGPAKKSNEESDNSKGQEEENSARSDEKKNMR